METMLLVVVVAGIFGVASWVEDRSLRASHATTARELARKHAEDHAKWIAYTDPLRMENEAQRALLNAVADTWAENRASAFDVIERPTDSAAKVRRRDAQEAHKRAAEKVIASGYGSPVSGVRVMCEELEGRCA